VHFLSPLVGGLTFVFLRSIRCPSLSGRDLLFILGPTSEVVITLPNCDHLQSHHHIFAAPPITNPSAAICRCWLFRNENVFFIGSCVFFRLFFLVQSSLSHCRPVVRTRRLVIDPLDSAQKVFPPRTGPLVSVRLLRRALDGRFASLPILGFNSRSSL